MLTMHQYHITVTMPDGTQDVLVDKYHDGACAAETAVDLFPQAQGIHVLRLATVLASGASAANAAGAHQ